MTPLKLLLIAPFVCEQSVGEGHSAYQLVSRLAMRFQVTLLTYHLRTDAPASQQLPGVRVIEWPDLPLVGRLPALNSQLTPGYIPFFLRARKWLRANLHREGFDLIHQLAPLGLRYPCPAVRLGVPYIMGPLGGSLQVPICLKAAVTREPLYRRLRSLDRLRFSFDPLLRASYSRARLLIAVAPYVQDILASIELPPLRFMSEAGVERTYPSATQRVDNESSFARLLFVGRVIRTKGVRDVIRALLHVRDPRTCLDIVGDGEDMHACQALVASSGLGKRVHFHGHLPRLEVDRFYRQADLFVFPSFREPSGKALLEAMSHGVPVIAANYGGPAAVIDHTCGRLVDPAPPDEFARGIAAAIDSALESRSVLMALGQGALKRIDDRYTWDKKIDYLTDIYRDALRHTGGGVACDPPA